MSVYDPLGFVAQFTVKAKILLQEIWRAGLGWDDELSDSLNEKWRMWLSELKGIEELKLQRCYSTKMKSAGSIQLHTFCDAGEKAFCAVSYIRTDNGDEVHTSFVTAKTRVAPLRPMSIPRLELQAALMASRLTKSIIENHDLNFTETYFWSDSSTVLRWLNSDARNYKPFVSHRIGEILELSNVENWHWLSTVDNVADEGTRDNKPCEFNANCRWYTGPSFLLEREEKWKINAKTENEVCTPEDLELRREFVNTISIVSSTLPEVTRFSSWTRIVRCTAWILRFVTNCKSKINNEVTIRTELNLEECSKGERLLLLQWQNEDFNEEIQLLKRGKKIGKSSNIYNLTPYLDEFGLLRMKGRLNAASCIENDIKYPIILHNKNPLSRLLIQYYHVLAGHNGQEFVFNEMRQKFWILSMRSAIRSAWNHCQVCKIKRAKPDVPEMGMIPKSRLQTNVRAFSAVGIDYFGPIQVTVGRHHEKRYGVLFMCLTTRAIHLEIAHSLTTDATIMAIQRMISRRGYPKKMYSDNGTNLRGADNEIKKSLKELNQAKIVSNLTTKGIEWKFIPPSAPHFGGSWERLIRSVKTALSSVLKCRFPKDETLQTLFAEAEGIVNGRPLTHVSVDPNDPESLTPNHFLMGTSNVAAFRGAMGLFSEDDLCLRKQWRIAQRLADHFWKRWIREYLPTLTRRAKWHQHKKNVAVWDLVFIADGNMIRNSWPRGIVASVSPGADGIVRVVDVKTAFGIFRRPVAKICILDVEAPISGKN